MNEVTVPTGIPGEIKRFQYLPEIDTFETAGRVMTTLEAIEESHPYWIGDFLIMAREKFEEAYAQLIPAGREQSYAQYLWVSERVPAENRVQLPSYSHARALASLDIQAQKAVIQSLPDNSTKKQVEAAVKQRKGVQAKSGSKKKESEHDKTLHLHVLAQAIYRDGCQICKQIQALQEEIVSLKGKLPG